MKNLPKISIVIPSLNKTKFIGETLQSIVDQKYENLEVIIRDGGSTDGTLAIIKKYAEKYPRVVSWTVKKREGQLRAINEGLNKATGDILTYLNADDIYQDGALKKVGEYFAKHSSSLWLVGKGDTVDENGNKIASWVDGYKNYLLKLNNYSWLLTVNYFFQSSVFLSRRAFSKYGPFTGTKMSVMEYDLWLKLGRVEMPKVLDTYLSSFRLIKGSLSVTEFKKILKADEEIGQKYTNNHILLTLHYLHNLGRVITVNLLGIG